MFSTNLNEHLVACESIYDARVDFIWMLLKMK